MQGTEVVQCKDLVQGLKITLIPISKMFQLFNINKMHY